MKIAISTENNAVCEHFGHAPFFTIVDVTDGKVDNTALLTPPSHQPGVLPNWMKELGVNVMITGGLGSRAREIFSQFGIDVLTGASGSIDEILKSYLEGNFKGGSNACNHPEE